MGPFATLSMASAFVHQATTEFSVRRVVRLGNMGSGVSTPVSVSTRLSVIKRMGSASVSRAGRASTATKSVPRVTGVRIVLPSATARMLACVTSVRGNACVFRAFTELNASKLVRPWRLVWDAPTTVPVFERIPRNATPQMGSATVSRAGKGWNVTQVVRRARGGRTVGTSAIAMGALATRSMANATVPQGKRARAVRRVVRTGFLELAANKTVRLADMEVRFVMGRRDSASVIQIIRITFARPVVRRERMGRIARASVAAGVIRRIVIRKRASADVTQVGWGRIVRNLVQAASMASTAVKLVSVRMERRAEDMMASAGVPRDGSDLGVRKAVLKAIMESIASIFVSASRRTTFAIRLLDVSCLVIMMVRSVPNH